MGIGVIPTVLPLIGWDTKAESKAIRKSSQPDLLKATQQGPGTVALDWQAPVPGKGEPVQSYIILHREHTLGQVFTDCVQVALAIKSEITRTNQPRFIQLEYRIIAINASSVSAPSNAVALVQ